jgi:hypothetical protein
MTPATLKARERRDFPLITHRLSVDLLPLLRQGPEG